MDEKNPIANQALGMLFICLFAGIAYKKYGIAVAYFVHHNRVSLGLLGFAVLLLILLGLVSRFFDPFVRWCSEQALKALTQNAIHLGIAGGGKFYLPHASLLGHVLVTGATGTGKTKGAVEPIIMANIRNGLGIVIIDGKADTSFRDQIYAQVVASGRERDFRFFSLHDTIRSNTFNPLVGDTPERVAERVFTSFEVENPYYREIQFSIFLALLRLVTAVKLTPTFSLLYELATSKDKRERFINYVPNQVARGASRYEAMRS